MIHDDAIFDAMDRLAQRGIIPDCIEMPAPEIKSVLGGPERLGFAGSAFGLRLIGVPGTETRVGGKRPHRRLEIVGTEWEKV